MHPPNDPNTIVAYFDGACAPKNPGGHAGAGWVLWHDGNLIGKGTSYNLPHSKYLGNGSQFSNNVAEFEALIEVFKTIEFYFNNGNLKEGSLKRLHCCGDSQLVINLMKGDWTPKNGLYINSYNEAMRRWNILLMFGVEITFEWVRREQNVAADLLSKSAIEPYLKGAKV